MLSTDNLVVFFFGNKQKDPIALLDTGLERLRQPKVFIKPLNGSELKLFGPYFYSDRTWKAAYYGKDGPLRSYMNPYPFQLYRPPRPIAF